MRVDSYWISRQPAMVQHRDHNKAIPVLQGVTLGRSFSLLLEIFDDIKLMSTTENGESKGSSDNDIKRKN